MSQEEFVAKHRHLLGGLVLDAATAQRNGAELSLWLKTAYAKIDTLLRQAHADCQPKENRLSLANGKAPAVQGKVGA